MKICLISGIKCSTNHGGFDIDGLYETQGLTGSESGLFNVAWGLAERGHEVHVFCKTSTTKMNHPKIAGASVHPLDVIIDDGFDAYIAWNEPDYLHGLGGRGVKIFSQQLNDFTLASPRFDRHVDVYAFPSQAHMEYMIAEHNVSIAKARVVANSTNLEFFDPATPKVPGSIAYISSPDRGLHHLLDIFPLVRERVPSATLKIYYRFWPWYEDVKKDKTLLGQRARYISERLSVLGQSGENGIKLVGPVPNKRLAAELSATALLAYPCAPVRFTEGFSIATLDGCAAGCLPVISDADVLGSVYAGVAEIVAGNPGREKDKWVATITRLLTDEGERSGKSAVARAFAERFSRQKIAEVWERLIEEELS